MQIALEDSQIARHELGGRWAERGGEPGGAQWQEMANWNLMSADRGLAKVWKLKLPDELALVDVNPPSGEKT